MKYRQDEESAIEIGSLQAQIDTLTDDALLMRELKAAVRGMSGLRISYDGPTSCNSEENGYRHKGRGLVTDEELRRIDRILNRIETEANQGV